MHHDPDGLLERMDYLRIGRIIDEYDPSQPIPEGCVRLHNRIYNIRSESLVPFVWPCDLWPVRPHSQTPADNFRDAASPHE